MDPPAPWVLKDSERYPGHVYYYNTLTHEASWIRPIPYPGRRRPWPPLIAVQEILIKHRDSHTPSNNKKSAHRSLQDARNKAKHCWKRILEGEEFAEVQKSAHDGQGQKERWITNESNPAEFNAGRILEIGEMCQPFETKEGIHILLRVG